jgi:type I restriction enzyme R subunit
LNWKKQQAVAAVKKEIEDEMDKGLPDSYDTKIYEKNVNVVFQHIYDYYDGDSHNIIKQ